MAAVRFWVAREWRQRWLALVALAVLVALAGGVATALWAGGPAADTAFERFQLATGSPNLCRLSAEGRRLGEFDPAVFTGAGRAVADIGACPEWSGRRPRRGGPRIPESEISNVV